MIDQYYDMECPVCLSIDLDNDPRRFTCVNCGWNGSLDDTADVGDDEHRLADNKERALAVRQG